MTNGMAGEQAEQTNKNVERGRATRAHVIEVTTRLFAAHGYDGTSVEMVQAGSGVSRGSLYHHFPGKEALFLAVLEEVGAGIARQGQDAARDVADPVALLRQGPLGLIRDCLAYAAGTGRIEQRHVDAFAHIVLAAANEVAMMVARADSPAGALADGESAFAEFLDRLLGDAPE